ncbi:hypothetical protein J568_3743, partial [Acinetobacter baumannii 6112]
MNANIPMVAVKQAAPITRLIVVDMLSRSLQAKVI